MKPRVWIGAFLLWTGPLAADGQPHPEEGLAQAKALFEAYQLYDKEGNCEGLASLISNYAWITVETPKGSHKIPGQDYKEILRGLPSPWVKHNTPVPQACLIGTDFAYTDVQFAPKGEHPSLRSESPKNQGGGTQALLFNNRPDRPRPMVRPRRLPHHPSVAVKCRLCRRLCRTQKAPQSETGRYSLKNA